MLAAIRPRVRSAGRAHVAILGLVVIAGALIRLRYMGEPMRFDEAFTFDFYAVRTLPEIASNYGLNNHILYTLLAHESARLFGEGVWVVRVPAFAAGIAIIPVSFAVGRALYDRDAALWAAALTATFAPLVDYSVNGRGYTLGTLLVLVALWMAATILHKRTASWAWGAFIVSSALAVYTVPTMAYGVAAVGIWALSAALWSHPRQGRLAIGLMVALAAAAGLSALLYSPVFGQRAWEGVNLLHAPRSHVPKLASQVWENWNRAAPHPLDWIVVLGFFTSAALHRRIARHPVPIAAAAAVTVAGIVAVAPISPYVRTWLFLLPLYLIPAGAGLSWLARRLGARLTSASAVSSVGAVCAAVAFGATMLDAGLRGADIPPVSDNDFVPLLRRFVPSGQHALINAHVKIAARYYMLRFGGLDRTADAVGPHERAAGHVVVVVPHFVSPLADARAAGARPAGHPRLLVHRTWIDFYTVPLVR